MSARLPLEALDAAHLDATARLHVAARAKQRRDLLRLRGEGWARSHAATRWVRGLQAWVHGVAGWQHRAAGWVRGVATCLAKGVITPICSGVTRERRNCSSCST